MDSISKIVRKLGRKTKQSIQLLAEEIVWFKRCIKYNNANQNEEAELSTLLVISHVLEKGITMPNRRYGFGFERVRHVIDNTMMCIEKYGSDHDEIQYAIGDLLEYKLIHDEIGFELPDDIVSGILKLKSYSAEKSHIESLHYNVNSFFTEWNSFAKFAKSRHTCRHYSKESIDIERVKKCIQLAQTAPSACNRQSTKVHIIASKSAKDVILKYQNGSRGFGQDADKFILITADQNCWDVRQQKSAYIDAGIFTMNLLYALHEERICACTLNAHIYHDQINHFYHDLKLKECEIPVVFIAIGNPKEDFVVAESMRIDSKNIISVL